jgi:hypothetical protein
VINKRLARYVFQLERMVNANKKAVLATGGNREARPLAVKKSEPEYHARRIK